MLKLLQGVRVLDLCKLIPGDLATMKLVELGAEVIKVEEPPLGDYLRGLPPNLSGHGLMYLMYNHGKKSIGLDYRSDEGREVLFDLLRTADALVEVSTPGRMKKLGLDYESVRQIKPDIVYCSVTGYGQDGPYRYFPSHGMNIDAAAGLVRLTRDDEGSPRIAGISTVGVQMGGIHAALGVVAALFARERTGTGSYVDASCWDAAVASNLSILAQGNLGAEGSDLMTMDLGARYDVYPTADDRVIFLCPIERRFWLSFCDVAGRPDLKNRGEWEGPMDFGRDDPGLRAEIRSVMRQRTLAEWMEVFNREHIPASPVLDVSDVEGDPHTVARSMIVEGDHPDDGIVKYFRIPLVLDGTEPSPPSPAPVLGQHTTEILSGAGYQGARIRELFEGGLLQGI